ncbi:MAG: hypothetical protein OXU23_21530, partial [Candidatus Poribacteria bacterium]|nr:hypothetical protein [Candidatus Poribacteria bacterium]MDE0466310.1 hypothetical protein [Candidatus Poribacteria bacterium]
MRKLFFYSLIVLTTIYTLTANSALPDWIAPELKKYPIEKYLFHIGQSLGTGEPAFKAATAVAHRKVTSRILDNAERIFLANKSELQHDVVQEHYSAVMEDYCDSRQEQPAMRLRGFSVRNLSVDLARTDPDTYALFYIDRDKLKQHYAEHVSELSKEINHLLESAKFAEEVFEIEVAVRKYLQTYPLYEALKEAEIIQIGAEYRYHINSTEAFKRLAKAATSTSGTLQMSHREVIKRVTELDSPMIVSADDVAKVIEFQLSRQRDTGPRKCWIEPVTYEDSEMICPFSQRFSEALLTHLNWPIIGSMHNFKQTAPDINKIDLMAPQNRITCSCWENGDEITIRTTVRNLNTGDFVATAVVRFLRSQIRGESIIYQPINYEQMRPEIDAFDPQNYPPLARDPENAIPLEELEVEVWTNRGKGSQRYVQDEKVKIFVRVNQTAYVRLLYTLADRKRTLLQDNYYIDASQANSVVEIGEFICAAPFGTEFLVVAARTEEFPPIETHEANGYFYLTDSDPKLAAQRFRGLKPIPPDTDEPHSDFLQSEVRIVVTTAEK